MLSHQDLVLDVEMTLVVVKIDVLTEEESGHDLVFDACRERHPWALVGRTNACLDLTQGLLTTIFILIAGLKKLHDSVNIGLQSPGNKDILLEKVVSVDQVEHVGESVL